MLTATDAITWRPRRIAIAGITGSGKTTLARRIAHVLDLPRTEIDSLYHGAKWQPRPSFESDVTAVLASEAWVIEWQYSATRAAIAARADTLVWLDLPFVIVFGRLIRRTIRRRLRRETLWNGNRERPLRTILTDRDHIIRWGLRTRRKLHEQVPPLEAALPALRIVRLRSVRDVEVWVRALESED